MLRMVSVTSFAAAVWLATSCILAAEEAKEPAVPPIKAVYFVPSDREPIEGREERLGRVMRHVQDFYRCGMAACGFGEKTFALEWDAPNRLKLYTVRGKKRLAEYGRQDAGAVRREVADALRQQGINPDNEVLIIFQVLLDWEGDRAKEIGPYVGGGSIRSGTAWVYDDRLLDAALLPSREPGGYYNGRCSIGQFNTHYIGGVAHELGHALSLPHDCERDAERREKGLSLMGGGNHTYGREERGEGAASGTFLSMASAIRLSRVRAFTGDSINRATQFELTSLDAKFLPSRGLALRGRLVAEPPLVGLIAFCDNISIDGDYDAKTWTTVPDSDGAFELAIDEWKPTAYELRLQGIHQNGTVSSVSVPYRLGRGGSGGNNVDLTAINRLVPIERLRTAFLASDTTKLTDAVADIVSINSTATQRELRRLADHLQWLRSNPEQHDPATLAPSVTKLDLMHAKAIAATTGWGPLQRGRVPEEVFIEVGGDFFTSGLYAHAPARTLFTLDGKWETFQTKYGIQNRHSGSVVFVVRADGREVFRSNVIAPRTTGETSLNVRGVNELELVVEDGGNGNNSDWGLWLEPTLKR